MWILILGLTCWLRSQRIRLIWQLTHLNVELEIRLRKPTDYSQKPTFKRLSSLGGAYALTNKREGKVWKVFGRVQDVDKDAITKLLIKEKLAVAYTGQNKKDIAAAQEANRLALIKEGKLQ